MKPFLKSALIFLTLVLFSQCEKDETIGTSTSFLNALIHKGVDTNGDGKISSSEAKAVTKLDISNEIVTDLGGIGSFSNLDTLICEYNKLTVIDMSDNQRLLYLDCGWNYDLKTLNVTKNRSLKHLSCGSHILTGLDVSNNPDLTYLYCPGCGLNTINVSKNLSLEWFGCVSNNLTSLNVSKNKALKSLYCDANPLENIDITMNNALTTLSCSYNNLTSLNVSQNLLLTDLRCDNNKLIILPVSVNRELQNLSCGGNMLTMLDLSNNTALVELSIYGMPSLLKVCVVVRPFPLANVSVVSWGSPNFKYSTDCSN
jgi:hypothetical protein